MMVRHPYSSDATSKAPNSWTPEGDTDAHHVSDANGRWVARQQIAKALRRRIEFTPEVGGVLEAIAQAIESGEL